QYAAAEPPAPHAARRSPHTVTDREGERGRRGEREWGSRGMKRTHSFNRSLTPLLPFCSSKIRRNIKLVGRDFYAHRASFGDDLHTAGLSFRLDGDSQCQSV